MTPPQPERRETVTVTMGERVVRGGSFTVLTADPVLIAVVKRCAELEGALTKIRHEEVARYRTLRRDVASIKRAIAAALKSGETR